MTDSKYDDAQAVVYAIKKAFAESEDPKKLFARMSYKLVAQYPHLPDLIVKADFQVWQNVDGAGDVVADQPDMLVTRLA
jgi:hypothetical protein